MRRPEIRWLAAGSVLVILAVVGLTVWRFDAAGATVPVCTVPEADAVWRSVYRPVMPEDLDR
jgi:hypothetical protein